MSNSNSMAVLNWLEDVIATVALKLSVSNIAWPLRMSLEGPGLPLRPRYATTGVSPIAADLLHRPGWQSRH